MDFYLNYLVFLALMYLLIHSLNRNSSLFAPANFFLSIWILNYALLMFFVPAYFLHYGASLFILVAGTLVYLASTGGERFRLKARFDKERIFGSLKYIAIASSVLGFWAAPLMLAHANGNVLYLFNIGYLRKIGRVVTYLRYNNMIDFPIYTTFLLAVNYYASLVNGVYLGFKFHKKEFKHFYLFLMPVLTAVLVSLITTEKAVTLFTGCLELLSFFVSFNALSQIHFKLSKKSMTLFGYVFVILLALFIFIQMNRLGYDDYPGAKKVVDGFKVYAFGHLSAFSVWFETYLGGVKPPLGLGRYTCSGLFDFLKIYTRVPGVFSDFSVISNQNDQTNVYTAFRALITDFSLYGSFVILSVSAFLSGIAYRNANKSLAFFFYLIVFYFFTVFSLFTSVLSYNTLLFAFGMLFMTLYIGGFYVSHVKKI